MALYTLPKRYHPDFSNPRDKPLDPVNFDDKNRFGLNRNDTVIILAGQGDRELLSGDPATLTVVNRANGRDYELSINSSKVTWGSTKVIDGSASMTILFKFKYNGDTNVHILGNWDNGATQQILVQTGAGGEIRCVVEDAVGARFGRISTTLLQSGKTYIIGISFQHDGSSNEMLMSIDGNAEITTSWFSQTVTSIFDAGGQEFSLGSHAFNSGAGMIYEYCVFTSVFLSQGLLSQATNNPFDILKPATPAMYFTTAAVTGGGNLLLTNRSIANFQGMRQ